MTAHDDITLALWRVVVNGEPTGPYFDNEAKARYEAELSIRCGGRNVSLQTFTATPNSMPEPSGERQADERLRPPPRPDGCTCAEPEFFPQKDCPHHSPSGEREARGVMHRAREAAERVATWSPQKQDFARRVSTTSNEPSLSDSVEGLAQDVHDWQQAYMDYGIVPGQLSISSSVKTAELIRRLATALQRLSEERDKLRAQVDRFADGVLYEQERVRSLTAEVSRLKAELHELRVLYGEVPALSGSREG